MFAIASALTAGALTLGLASCSNSHNSTNSTASTTAAGSLNLVPADNPLEEANARSQRVVIAYDGGIRTLDASTGNTLATTERAGFMRLNNAGNGRHVWVSAGDQFLLYDAATESRRHEDHYHYYSGTPQLTDVSVEAPHAGHVVVHNGKTVLFSDGDGGIQIMDSARIGKRDLTVERSTTASPHHGVAVVLKDGGVFQTDGTSEERHTVQVVREGKTIAKTDDCPGAHGEAAAQPTATGDVVVMGCTNGPVVYRDGEFHKVPVSDTYARSGNLAGSDDSPIVLGDYKVNPDPGESPERPTRVALINTLTDSMQLVDLPSSYWFRSLGRGPSGEALVLTYDGNLVVIDQNTGAITRSIPVITPWTEKDDWQQPGPILKVDGRSAFITDAATRELVRVDLSTGEVTNRYTLDITPVEMVVTSGFPA